MAVGTVNDIHLRELNHGNAEVYPPHEKLKEADSSQTSHALHQVFNKETLESLTTESTSQLIKSISKNPSLWQRFLNWWKEPVIKPKTNAKAPNKPDSKNSPKPIDQIPHLDKPDEIPDDLQNAKFPPSIKKNSNTPLGSKEITDALSLMKEESLEAILFIIFKAQLEVEKETANVSEKTYTKYQHFQELQQKMLSEIKEVLANDEKVAKRLKTAQNVVAAASFISGIAAAAMSFGLLGPVGGFIGATLGSKVAAAFMSVATAIGKVGPALTAGLTALTMGSNSYFKRRYNLDLANHETYSHQDKHYSQLLEDWNQRLMSLGQTNKTSQEAPFRLMKRNRRMLKNIFKK